MRYVLIFVVGFMIDVFYTLYTFTVVARDPFWAANWALIIGVCSIYSIREIVDKWILMVPYFLGLWSGTFVAIMWLDPFKGTF